MPLDLFTKTVIPEIIPSEMQKIVDELKLSSNKRECLQKTYNILTERFKGGRVKTYTNLAQIFKTNLEYIWSREGFLHCTNLNYLARVFLIKSEFFKEEDLRLRWTQIWLISPHQYLQVKIDNGWIDIDIWAKSFGIEFGNHAKGFQ